MPIEPTEEMLDAGHAMSDGEAMITGNEYRAMIAASPSPITEGE